MQTRTQSVSDVLEKSPKYLRAPKVSSEDLKVDRNGGDYGAGLIRGASLVTKGEALGHFVWLDQEFIESVRDDVNAKENGVKARFTHPSLSGDGLGSFLGRAKNAYTEDGKTFADIHFAKASHKTPDGNLAEYVMNLAEEDPESFAISIVYEIDWDAENEFSLEHRDENGNFQTPDADNLENLPHARSAGMRATDFVDEPAANPEGLFHKGHELAEEADQLCAFALGISKEKPETRKFGIDSDRLASFVSRFLSNHNLELKEKPMADTTQEADSKVDTDNQVDAKLSEIRDAVEKLGESPKEGESVQEQAKRYLEAFGEDAAQYLADGLTFEQGLANRNEKLSAELAERDEEIGKLKQRLSAPNEGGEDAPVELTPGGDEKEKKSFIRFK